MDRGIPKVPLAEVHVHATVAPEYHALRFQQFPLFLPVRHGPALAVNHPVARKMKLRTGVFQNMPYQPGMVRVTGKLGNLSVCHHLSSGNSADDGIYFFFERLDINHTSCFNC